MNKLMKLKEGESEESEVNFAWGNLKILEDDLTLCWQNVSVVGGLTD